MSAHTPGPWKAEIWDYSHAVPPRKELNIQNDANLIATLQCDFSGENPYTIPQGEAQANADFIVRACNNHDELLSALKEIAVVEGTCTLSNGVLVFADGSSLNLRTLIDTADGEE